VLLPKEGGYPYEALWVIEILVFVISFIVDRFLEVEFPND